MAQDGQREVAALDGVGEQLARAVATEASSTITTSKRSVPIVWARSASSSAASRSRAVVRGGDDRDLGAHRASLGIDTVSSAAEAAGILKR